MLLFRSASHTGLKREKVDRSDLISIRCRDGVKDELHNNRKIL